MKLLKFLYGITGLAVFLILVWLFAVPNELIQQKIEEAVSRSGNGTMALSIKGIRKGVFFSLSADTVNLSIDDQPAISINDLSINFTPRHLNAGKLAFLVRGKIGTGTVKGILMLPLKGNFKIDKAGLDSIPYLNRFGMSANGHLSSDIILNNNEVEAVFNIPDLNIDNPDVTMIPLINTFRRIQGSVHLDGNDLRINSISLEGEKGFARLKGQIRNGLADMTLELMPVERSLNSLESMIIGKYIISPGYYAVPINGPLPNL
ncbi:MAG: type II secretion system protein GspN [Nitrospira sp.]|nr:type II secretion system protein GspN [Nitrospira sp.]